jgi:hypothetical protein
MNPITFAHYVPHIILILVLIGVMPFLPRWIRKKD